MLRPWDMLVGLKAGMGTDGQLTYGETFKSALLKTVLGPEEYTAAVQGGDGKWGELAMKPIM